MIHLLKIASGCHISLLKILGRLLASKQVLSLIPGFAYTDPERGMGKVRTPPPLDNHKCSFERIQVQIPKDPHSLDNHNGSLERILVHIP